MGILKHSSWCVCPHFSAINKRGLRSVQYIPINMHTVFALLCFVAVIHWPIFPHPSGLLHWHCGNLTIAPVPAKQPWWIWINTSCEFIMNDCITTTKQSTTKPCAYFLGYTVCSVNSMPEQNVVATICYKTQRLNRVFDTLYHHNTLPCVDTSLALELQHGSGRSKPSLAEMTFSEHDLILYSDTGDNEHLPDRFWLRSLSIYWQGQLPYCSRPLPVR